TTGPKLLLISWARSSGSAVVMSRKLSPGAAFDHRAERTATIVGEKTEAREHDQARQVFVPFCDLRRRAACRLLRGILGPSRLCSRPPIGDSLDNWNGFDPRRWLRETHQQSRF